MARTTVAASTPRGPATGTIAANALDIAWTAADASNLNQTLFVGTRMRVQARNSGAGARTITITSLADPTYARSGDVSAFSIGAGEYVAFDVDRGGFQQSDGYLYWQAEHAEVLVSVQTLP